MSKWTRSNVSREQLLLVEVGQLPPLTTTVECRVASDKSVSHPKGYVVSFVAFHERGFSVSAGRFIRGVLFEYGRGDDRLHQSLDEGGMRQRLHPGVTDQLEQWLAQGVVLPAERP
jgi:hypothetical protein